MRIGVTGTPGTGKTTATSAATLDRPVVHLNDVIRQEDLTSGWDEERGSAIADLSALRDWLNEQPPSVVVESHLAHLVPVDHVIVLRCDPAELEGRLRGRLGDTDGADAKISENVESERLDVIYVEALDRHGAVHVTEIDTTDRSVAETAKAIEQAIAAADRGDASVADPAGEP